MKIYISVDQEGVSGVVHREHTSPQGYDYELARRLMTDEANAAVRAAIDNGATEVWVSDSHGGNQFRSILLDRIHPEAHLITGGPRRLGQLDGLDKSFAMVFLIGYHTMHNLDGVLNHTINGQAVHRVTLNGVEVGEIGINAALAGHFGVPIGVVSGDDRTVAEAKALLPWVSGATVKWYMSRYSARCLSPGKAHGEIYGAITDAMTNRKRLKPYKLGGNIKLHLSFKETGSAESAARVQGARRVDSHTIEFVAKDMETIYENCSAMVELWQPAWGAWIRGH
jgi:D-amino peptidase